MATRKTTTTEPVTENAPVETKPVDPWSVYQDVYIPRENGQNTKFCAVNGRSMLVPCGRTVSVPLPIAKVIERSQLAIEKAEKNSAEMREN